VEVLIFLPLFYIITLFTILIDIIIYQSKFFFEINKIWGIKKNFRSGYKIDYWVPQNESFMINAHIVFLTIGMINILVYLISNEDLIGILLFN
jgi:hypothetical protein